MVKKKYKLKYFMNFLGNIELLLDISAILPFIWCTNHRTPA